MPLVARSRYIQSPTLVPLALAYILVPSTFRESERESRLYNPDEREEGKKERTRTRGAAASV